MNDERIQQALAIAMRSGGVDGSHHKAWVIDQMIRALTGCPLVTREAKDAQGVSYRYKSYGRSAAYKDFVKDYEDGEDGPDTYFWDVGIAP